MRWVRRKKRWARGRTWPRRLRARSSGWFATGWTTRTRLSDARYGEKLLSCFARIRRELPVGYAAFHLPWVLAWHKANRQYKQACALLEEFSSKRK